jgi:hypothetical protein
MAYWSGFSSPQYVAAWQPLERISTICLLLVGWEAYQLTAKNYPSPGTYGRRTLALAVIIALGISILPFAIEGLGRYWHNGTWVVAVLIRTATLTVGAGLVIAVRRLRFVPIPEQKNLRNNRSLIVFYCAGQAVGLSALVITHNIGWIALHLTTTAICWLSWPFAMTAAGEELSRRAYSAADKVAMRMQLAEVRLWLGQAVASLPVRRNAEPR